MWAGRQVGMKGEGGRVQERWVTHEDHVQCFSVLGRLSVKRGHGLPVCPLTVAVSLSGTPQTRACLFPSPGFPRLPTLTLPIVKHLGVLALIHCHPVRRKVLTVVRFAEKLIVTQFVVIRSQSSKLPLRLWSHSLLKCVYRHPVC